ncbi:FemAB family PEP-CTERM system-associated protein [Planctomycetota bacterium]|nr:FemAB family PEP-CTERM system-associated protein [Planctomycetota bacterium]
MIHIEHEFNQQTCDQINNFLYSAPIGVCGEHDPRWLNVLKHGLGHRVMAIISRNSQNQIDGYCPLALVKSALFGRFLVSLPYLNRAGVIASSPEIANAISTKAADAANLVNAQYLELRHMTEQQLTTDSLPESRNEKLIMALDLAQFNQDQDALFKAIGPKVRNQVRKGEKNNLTIQWGSHELIDDFYNIFAINMRDLGTPVYSKRLFESMATQFSNDCEFAVVSYQDKPISAAVLVHDSLTQDKRTQVPSASCLRDYNFTNANMWMYHQLLLRAMQRGSEKFDFGRSSEDSGTYRFKKQWGAKPHACTWQYHVRKGAIGSMRPDDEGMKRKVEMWKKMPLWITKAIGPSIVKGIP